MFNRLNITARLAITAIVPALVLALVIAIGVRTFGNVKIGSRPYKQVVQTNELVADLHRPAASVLESYLVASQLANYKFKAPVLDRTNTEDPATARTIAELRLKLQANERDFFDRQGYWKTNLEAVADGNEAIAKKMAAELEVSLQTGTDFFDIIDHEFLPKIDAPIAADTVSSLLSTLTRADALWVKHRDAVAALEQDARSLKDPLESKVNDDVNSGLASLLLISISGLGVIVLVGFAVAVSIRRPVNRLTEAATVAASVELPQAVDAIRRGDSETAREHTSMSVGGGEEFEALAAAFESMRVTALDLASAQAKQRLRFAELFVNLGRRTQSLVGRTLGLLTSLEKEERDPEVLENLFKLDHLLTRMRRNASSLLVLAGAEPPRSWGQPVELIDVVRGAVSEIEAYQRVSIEPMPLVRVKAAFTADLAHLVAELLENATLFSPPQTEVRVLGRRTEEGYLVSVVDEGIGMTIEEYEDANRRIVEAASLDQVPSRVLGLHVVGRLAHRMGIMVRLSEAPAQGSVARVLIPFNLTDDPAGDDIDSVGPAAVPSSPAELAAMAAVVPAAPVASVAAASSAPIASPVAVRAALSAPAAAPAAAPAVVPPVVPAEATAGPDALGASSAPPVLDPAGDPSGAALPPPVSAPAEPRRRVRGASGTAPRAAMRESVPARDAEAVRGALSDLQGGVARGRSDAAELVERPDTGPASFPVAPSAFQVPPPAPPGPSMAPAPAPVSEPAVPTSAGAPSVAPAPAAMAGSVPEASTEPPKRRVRGAQVFDGGRRDRGAVEPRSADDVRSALSSLQSGQQRGRQSIEQGENIAGHPEGSDEQ
ncbi:MAG: sensor histidine kinase [Acidimicrobiia bacterium]